MTEELKTPKRKPAAPKAAGTAAPAQIPLAINPASAKTAKAPFVAPAKAAKPVAKAAAPKAAAVPAAPVVDAPVSVAPVIAKALNVPAAPVQPAVQSEPAIKSEAIAAPAPVAEIEKMPVMPVAASTAPETVKPSPPKSAAPVGASTSKKDVFTMTTTTTAMTDTIQTAMKDAAEKAKATMEKSQAAMGDMGAFAKGNVEAVVEAGKILASGMQEMSKGYMTESKSVVETMTAEIKDLAAVKSPAEFFEKQSAMMRKQFDAAVAASSKNSEAMLKLASEAFQPISNRVSLAVEKFKHAA